MISAQLCRTPKRRPGGKDKKQAQADAEAKEAKAKEDGVVTLESGLMYKVLRDGDGENHPKASTSCECHYEGKLIDGTVFDSSVERKSPATFPVNGVIAGWTEALQLMQVGAKYKLFIPADLAYGKSGAGRDIGPNATLIFEVELLSIKGQEEKK